MLDLVARRAVRPLKPEGEGGGGRNPRERSSGPGRGEGGPERHVPHCRMFVLENDRGKCRDDMI